MEQGLFHGYCYGPVDLLSVEKNQKTMWLRMRTAAGGRARAVYEDCVYWQLGRDEVGQHISLVRRLSAEELLKNTDSSILRELQKNSDHVPQLLRDWEQLGLHLYVHYGAERNSEYLVAAHRMFYIEDT